MKKLTIVSSLLLLSLCNSAPVKAALPSFGSNYVAQFGQNTNESDRERYYNVINRIYQDVLGRDADYRGLRTWSREMAEGATEREIRREIAESDEAIDAINDIYKSMLNRSSDSSGLRTWTRTLANGGNLDDVRRGIANSREAEEAINRIYQQLLGRNADSSGMRTWKRELANGGSLLDIQREIADSDEARRRPR